MFCKLIKSLNFCFNISSTFLTVNVTNFVSSVPQ